MAREQPDRREGGVRPQAQGRREDVRAHHHQAVPGRGRRARRHARWNARRYARWHARQRQRWQRRRRTQDRGGRLTAP